MPRPPHPQPRAWHRQRQLTAAEPAVWAERIGPGPCYLCRRRVPDAVIVAPSGETACLAHARRLAADRPRLRPQLAAIDAALADAARCLLPTNHLLPGDDLSEVLEDVLVACDGDAYRATQHRLLPPRWHAAADFARTRVLLRAAWELRHADLKMPDDEPGRYAGALHEHAVLCGPDDGPVYLVGMLADPYPLPGPDEGMTAALLLLAAAQAQAFIWLWDPPDPSSS